MRQLQNECRWPGPGCFPASIEPGPGGAAAARRFALSFHGHEGGDAGAIGNARNERGKWSIVSSDMPRKGCLNRPTLLAVARGQCPKERLPLVQRHLASCARCRASVVAAASGIRGPGETVAAASGIRGPGETVYMRRPRAADRRWPKWLAVAASLLAAGGAWLYGASLAKQAPKTMPPTASEVRTALKPAEPPPPRPAMPPSTERTRYVGVSVVHSEPAESSVQSSP
jgi:hypothetical protein